MSWVSSVSRLCPIVTQYALCCTVSSTEDTLGLSVGPLKAASPRGAFHSSDSSRTGTEEEVPWPGHFFSSPWLLCYENSAHNILEKISLEENL